MIIFGLLTLELLLLPIMPQQVPPSPSGDINSSQELAELLQKAFREEAKQKSCVPASKIVLSATSQLLNAPISFAAFKRLLHGSLGKAHLYRSISLEKWQILLCEQGSVYTSDNYFQPAKDAKIKNLFPRLQQQYPYLYRNMRQARIPWLLSLLPQHLKQQFSMVHYLISDNNTYAVGRPSKICPRVPDDLFFMGQFLPALTEFVIIESRLGEQELIRWGQNQDWATNIVSFEENIELYRQVLVELPAFLYQKDPKDRVQFNKFLMPHCDFTSKSRWDRQNLDVQFQSQIYPWKSKLQNILYIESTPSSSQTSKIIKQLLLKGTILKEHWLNSLNKYLLWTGDVSLSYVGLILRSNSLLLRQETGQLQWFDDQLVADRHFKWVAEDLSDLDEKVKQLKNEDTEAQKIAQRGTGFARAQLSTVSIHQKWVNMLNEYAAVYKLAPQQVPQRLEQATWISQRMIDNSKLVGALLMLTITFHMVRLCLVRPSLFHNK